MISEIDSLNLELLKAIDELDSKKVLDLLENGVNVKDENGFSALMHAFQKGGGPQKKEIIKHLLTFGADPLYKNDGVDNLLGFAAEEVSRDIFDLLFENIKSRDCISEISLLVSEPSDEIMSILACARCHRRR